MASMLPGEHVTGAFDILKPLARGFATIAIAGVGMLLCSTVGSLAYPIGGVGVIFGGVVGLVAFLIIGCCATGSWRDFLPSSADVVNMSTLLPPALAVQVGGKGQFTMILTIHGAENVKVQGQMPWTSPDLYVEVHCEDNPTHNTCVKNDGKWGEKMKLEIYPLTQSVLLKVMNQDLFGSSSVGYVCVDVMKDILEPNSIQDGRKNEFQPFPQRRPFAIEAGQGDYLRYGSGHEKPVLILSFDHIDTHKQLQAEDRSSLKRSITASGMGDVGIKNYGAANPGPAKYIASMQFNPDIKPPKPMNV